MEFSAWKNQHQDKTCVIMANGPSLTTHPVEEIPPAVGVIGVNRSYEIKWPDYHCATDEGQLRRAPGVYRELARTSRLWVTDSWPFGHRVPAYPGQTFSFDLEEGAVGSIQGVGSAAYFALQVAVYLGFTHIYFLGLDLSWIGGRAHFYSDGVDQDPFLLARMNTLFLEAKAALANTAITVELIGPRSKCTAFKKVRWPWS